MRVEVGTVDRHGVLGATSKPQGELQLCEAWTSTRVHESAKAGKFMSALKCHSFTEKIMLLVASLFALEVTKNDHAEKDSS